MRSGGWDCLLLGPEYDQPMGAGLLEVAAQATPVAVAGLPGTVTAVAAGGAHTCALTATGAVFCWGDNSFGQLGNGSTALGLAPVAVVGLEKGVQAIAAGSGHSCALLADDQAGQRVFLVLHNR